MQINDPGALVWDNPNDAQYTWHWAKQAFPEPLTPLKQSIGVYHLQG